MRIGDWSSDVCSSDLALNRVADEAALIGKRALILSTPEQASAGRNVFALLGPLAGGLFDRATMHVPVSIVEEAPVAAKEIGAYFTVAIGGGSTTGLRSEEHTSELQSLMRISHALL